MLKEYWERFSMLLRRTTVVKTYTKTLCITLHDPDSTEIKIERTGVLERATMKFNFRLIPPHITVHSNEERDDIRVGRQKDCAYAETTVHDQTLWLLVAEPRTTIHVVTPPQLKVILRGPEDSHALASVID